MARLAIAKDFLAEYAKLDKDARRAVEAVVTEFAQRPHAWRYLEKPRRSLDDRIRFFRVNSLWRGVVLAPDTGDEYCLVTILPHDKAYAYAAGHRFSVNQALGVLEARDEQTIQQLRPSLRSAAKPADRRLFADVTDAGLIRLGVDAQVLAVVRLLADEADLERLQMALPDAQYAALYALSCGMTVDEAWAEVARLFPVGAPPEQVDQVDPVAAMERSPEQVTFVSGQQELPRILAHPFAAWRTFLHSSQREIAYRPSYAGPAQVTGGPGTGKTVAVLHRAAFLAARAATPPEAGQPAAAAQVSRPGPGTAQILVTTFNGILAEALHAQLCLLIPDAAVRSRIDVLNVDRLAYGVVRQARGTPVIADERVLRTRWAEAAADAGLAFTPAYLKHEWEQVILAQRIYDSRVSLASLQISVRGRSRRLSLSYRTTQEILARAVPLLGADPVVGLDGEVDSLLGYRSPMRGQCPQLEMAATRDGEFAALAERIRSWQSTGIEPQAIGVAARSASLVREAREALKANGVMTVPLRGPGDSRAVRVGTMHAMKGLEFQALAVIGVEQGLVPESAAITPESEDAVAHAQDLQRERCVLFAACTRARDHLFVSGTGAPSTFLPADAAVRPDSGGQS